MFWVRYQHRTYTGVLSSALRQEYTTAARHPPPVPTGLATSLPSNHVIRLSWTRPTGLDPNDVVEIQKLVGSAQFTESSPIIYSGTGTQHDEVIPLADAEQGHWFRARSRRANRGDVSAWTASINELPLSEDNQGVWRMRGGQAMREETGLVAGQPHRTWQYILTVTGDGYLQPSGSAMLTIQIDVDPDDLSITGSVTVVNNGTPVASRAGQGGAWHLGSDADNPNGGIGIVELRPIYFWQTTAGDASTQTRVIARTITIIARR